jgi:hypothetical protein
MGFVRASSRRCSRWTLGPPRSRRSPRFADYREGLLSALRVRAPLRDGDASVHDLSLQTGRYPARLERTA